MNGTLAVTAGPWVLVLGAAALFGALVLLLLPLTGPRVRRRRLATELSGTPRRATRDRFAALGAQATSLAERALVKNEREQRLGRTLERAGVDMRAPEFVVLVASVAIGCALVGLLLSGLALGLLLAAAAIGVFAIVLRRKASQRLARFEEQLPDALQLLSGGLRAGHSLPQSVDALVHEAEAPTCDEFRRVLFEVQLGHPLPSAMRAMAERMGSEDFDWVVQAVEIQRDVGGDLAALLDNVTRTIRDRNRVRRQIDTLTAEGRLSAVILILLPLGMFGFMAVANPDYLEELTTTGLGNLLLVIGGTLLVVGGFWLRRIIRLIY